MKKGFKKILQPVLTISTVLIILIMAVYIGSVDINIGEITEIITGGQTDMSSASAIIILQLRLPRVLLAFIVGACLALSGVILQGILKNPLADPYVIGASAGSSVGAAIAIIVTFKAGAELARSFWGISIIPLFAFLCSVLTVLTVYRIARVGNRVPVITLLLAGVAMNSILSSLLSLLIYFNDDAIFHPLIYWLMGSFSGSSWQQVLAVLPYPIICGIYLAAKADILDMFALGEEKAQQLGVSVEREKFLLLIFASLLTGVAVSVSGVIAFVGLIIPHIVRMIFGPKSLGLMVRSVLFGGCFVVMADVIARSLLNVEIPVGIITSLAGGPFFIYLLRKEQSANWGVN